MESISQELGQLNRKSLTERSVQKIKNANLLTRLIKYCNNELELTGKQVDVHLKLVNKYLPDLQAVQHNVDVNHNVVDIHTLNARLSALGHDPQSVFQAISSNQPIDAVAEKIESDTDSISEGGTPDL